MNFECSLDGIIVYDSVEYSFSDLFLGHVYVDDEDALIADINNITILYDSGSGISEYISFNVRSEDFQCLCIYGGDDSSKEDVIQYFRSHLTFSGYLNEGPEFNIISSDNITSLFAQLKNQINVASTVGVLALICFAFVSLVFMWWGVRKIVRMLTFAFQKGKISLK